ncbi:MAG TPA: hypothetical protein VHS58_12040 [Acetobacteraceae bacterium]|nr:hypothetical protein [Acetobacteraceae bacterium]
MGIGVRAEDIYIPTFLDLFNLRFGHSLSRDPASPNYGGIAEIAALQREFQIFRGGRPFVETARLLGLGGIANDPAKNWWFEQLAKLPHFASDTSENGDERIVNALIANLARDQPLPCSMRAHDGREMDASRVIVSENATPLFFFDYRNYLTISLPMRPSTGSATQAGSSGH